MTSSNLGRLSSLTPHTYGIIGPLVLYIGDRSYAYIGVGPWGMGAELARMYRHSPDKLPCAWPPNNVRTAVPQALVTVKQFGRLILFTE